MKHLDFWLWVYKRLSKSVKQAFFQWRLMGLTRMSDVPSEVTLWVLTNRNFED
jgi:hypothetical protein